MSLRTLTIIGAALVLLLLAALGWEANRGRALRKQPPAPVVDAKPLDVTLLPEFKVNALQTRKETVERPLFVPTRRPAPPPEAVEKAPSKVERGLFILSGTAIQGATRLAFLRNAKDNKPRTVRVGDVVEGMNVSVITADRVVLTAGGQEEELLLKVATGQRGTAPSAAAARQAGKTPSPPPPPAQAPAAVNPPPQQEAKKPPAPAAPAAAGTSPARQQEANRTGTAPESGQSSNPRRTGGGGGFGP